MDAYGCSEQALQEKDRLSDLFQAIVTEMKLKPIGSILWHQFPITFGLTGIWLLQESHLTIHTFPEDQTACINLFCCVRRPKWDWERRLPEWLGAKKIEVKEQLRRHGHG